MTPPERTSWAYNGLDKCVCLHLPPGSHRATQPPSRLPRAGGHFRPSELSLSGPASLTRGTCYPPAEWEGVVCYVDTDVGESLDCVHNVYKLEAFHIGLALHGKRGSTGRVKHKSAIMPSIKWRSRLLFQSYYDTRWQCFVFGSNTVFMADTTDYIFFDMRCPCPAL